MLGDVDEQVSEQQVHCVAYVRPSQIGLAGRIQTSRGNLLRNSLNSLHAPRVEEMRE